MTRGQLLSLAGSVLVVAALEAAGCAHKKPPVTTTPPPPETTAVVTPPPRDTVEEQPGAHTGQEAAELQDARFAYDSAELDDDARSTLSSDGAWMLKNTSARVQIEGHCDERGTVEYNLALGERRAAAAKDFLVNYGVPDNRLSTISYGKERPLDPGHDEEAWAKNRRVHFVVLH